MVSPRSKRLTKLRDAIRHPSSVGTKRSWSSPRVPGHRGPRAVCVREGGHHRGAARRVGTVVHEVRVADDVPDRVPRRVRRDLPAPLANGAASPQRLRPHGGQLRVLGVELEDRVGVALSTSHNVLGDEPRQPSLRTWLLGAGDDHRPRGSWLPGPACGPRSPRAFRPGSKTRVNRRLCPTEGARPWRPTHSRRTLGPPLGRRPCRSGNLAEPDRAARAGMASDREHPCARDAATRALLLDARALSVTARTRLVRSWLTIDSVGLCCDGPRGRRKGSMSARKVLRDGRSRIRTSDLVRIRRAPSSARRAAVQRARSLRAAARRARRARVPRGARGRGAPPSIPRRPRSRRA